MKWAEKEDQIIVDNVGSASYRDISSLLNGRTQKSVEHRAAYLGFSSKRLTSCKLWEPEEFEVLKRYQSGELSREEVLRLLPNRSSKAISSKVNKSELVFRRGWSRCDDLFLTSHYKSNSLKDLAAVLDRSEKSIKHRLLRLNLYRGRRYKLDEFYFHNVTNESAYWAGFIAADGNICKKTGRLSIAISRKDEAHLLKFKNNIGYEGNIRYRSSEQWGKVHHSVVLGITSRIIPHDLKSIYNIIPNKSLILKPPSLTNLLHIKSFIVGYTDGDGFVSLTESGWRIGFAGTFSMMSFIKEIFDSEYPAYNDRYPQVNTQGRIFRYMLTGKRVNSVLEDLITLDIPFMERKWKKVFDFFGALYE